MGYLTLKLTMERISVARKRSPIAVFRTYRAGLLRSVFANTSASRSVLRKGDPSLIGVFSADMDQTKVKDCLKRAINDLHHENQDKKTDAIDRLSGISCGNAEAARLEANDILLTFLVDSGLQDLADAYKAAESRCGEFWHA